MKHKAAVLVLLLVIKLACASACSPGDVACGGRERTGGSSTKAWVSSRLPRALLQGLTAAEAAAAPAAQQRRISRKLQQFAATGNFLSGALDASYQRAIAASGVAAQLSNFYGVEGIGFRHRLGALPAPGGLEVLALAGPGCLPTPKGLVAGWIGGNIEGLASTFNPLTTQAIAETVQDIAASQNAGQLVGATGFSGLGLQTGSAATALLDAAHGGGLAGSDGGGLGGGLGDLAGVLGGGGGGKLADGLGGLVGALGGSGGVGMGGGLGGLVGALGGDGGVGMGGGLGDLAGALGGCGGGGLGGGLAGLAGKLGGAGGGGLGGGLAGLAGKLGGAGGGGLGDGLAGLAGALGGGSDNGDGGGLKDVAAGLMQGAAGASTGSNGGLSDTIARLGLKAAQALAYPSTGRLEQGASDSSGSSSDAVGMAGVGSYGPGGGLAGNNLGATAGAFAGQAISSMTNTAANAMIDKGATQGQLLSGALAASGADTSGSMGALVANKAALQAAMVRGGGSVAGQAAIAAGQVKDAAANVAKAAAGAIGSGMGGVLNLAGKFVGKLSGLTGHDDESATSSSGNDGSSYVGSNSGYVMSSDGSSFTMPAGTTWSDGSTGVTTTNGSPGATPTAITYTYATPPSSNAAGVPPGNGQYSTGAAGLPSWQTTTANGVTQGSTTSSGTPQQYSLQGSQQGFRPAATAATQSGSGLVSVTGPFPDMTAAFAG